MSTNNAPLNYNYYDNTRLSTYRECRRKFYLRHVRDLVPLGKAPALAFGSAWHDAMDVVWAGADSSETDERLTINAYRAWEDRWVEEGFPALNSMDKDWEDELRARTPNTALEMLHFYVAHWRPWLASVDIVEIEQPFAVPLDPDDPSLTYVGRRDKGFIEHGRFWVGEHKTTTSYRKDGPFRADFIESFSPNSQVDGYIHSSHMQHGDRVAGVMVDAALVHKTIHDGFRHIPVDRQLEMMDAWLFETLQTIYDLHSDLKSLEAYRDMPESKRSPYLPAFRKNTQACNSYGGCPYRDICKYMQNPEEEQEFPGYQEERWEPFDILHLEKIGLEREER